MSTGSPDRLTWVLPSISQVQRSGQKVRQSDQFQSAKNVKWHLEVNTTDCRPTLSLVLDRCEGRLKPTEIRCVVSPPRSSGWGDWEIWNRSVEGMVKGDRLTERIFPRSTQVRLNKEREPLTITCHFNTSASPVANPSTSPVSRHDAKSPVAHPPNSPVQRHDDNEFAGDFCHLLNSGLFSDMTISTEENDFPVHKAILASRVPLWREQFEAEETDRLEMRDVSGHAMAALLHYVYTGETGPIQPSVARDLSKLAERLGLPQLQAECDQMLTTVTPNLQTVCPTLAWAIDKNHKEIKSNCIRLIKTNRDEVDKAELAELISKHPEVLTDLI